MVGEIEFEFLLKVLSVPTVTRATRNHNDK